MKRLSLLTLLLIPALFVACGKSTVSVASLQPRQEAFVKLQDFAKDNDGKLWIKVRARCSIAPEHCNAECYQRFYEEHKEDVRIIRHPEGDGQKFALVPRAHGRDLWVLELFPPLNAAHDTQAYLPVSGFLVGGVILSLEEGVDFFASLKWQ